MEAAIHKMNRENRRFPHCLRHTLSQVFMSVSANRPNAVTLGHIPDQCGREGVVWLLFVALAISHVRTEMTEALHAGLLAVGGKRTRRQCANGRKTERWRRCDPAVRVF